MHTLETKDSFRKGFKFVHLKNFKAHSSKYLCNELYKFLVNITNVITFKHSRMSGRVALKYSSSRRMNFLKFKPTQPTQAFASTYKSRTSTI